MKTERLISRNVDPLSHPSRAFTALRLLTVARYRYTLSTIDQRCTRAFCSRITFLRFTFTRSNRANSLLNPSSLEATQQKWISLGENLFCGTISISFPPRVCIIPFLPASGSAVYEVLELLAGCAHQHALVLPRGINLRVQPSLLFLILERSWKFRFAMVSQPSCANSIYSRIK